MIQLIYGQYIGQFKRNFCQNGISKKRCFIGFYLETLALDGRERMGVLLVLTFGEGAGAEKVKSLKEIKIQLGCGKDIVVIRVL